MKIIQISNAVSTYDAISNQIFAIAECLTEHGFENEILVKWKEASLEQKPIKSIDENSNPDSSKDDIIIFHHYTKSLFIDLFKNMKGKKILYYHNITPPIFFEKFNPQSAGEQQAGLEQLQTFKSLCSASAGSAYNVYELKKLGFSNNHEIPYYIDPRYYTNKNTRISNNEKSYDNLIFVGRIAPNKKHEDLIKIFYYYSNFINPNSRLFVTGRLDHFNPDPYQTQLKSLINKLGLEHKVIFTGLINQEELLSLYRMADIFVCMSEHEGFCVPLLECMLMNVPIIAYNSTSIPYTVKNSGILVNDKDFKIIAKLIYEIIHDKTLQSEIILKQSKTFQTEYSFNKFKNSLISMIKNVSN